MPTYRNTSTELIGKPGGITFSPGEVKEVYKIFDDDIRLLKISDEPYYNPIVKIDDLVFTAANDNKEINIDYTKISVVIIQKIKSTDLKVYVNSISNEPAIPIGEGESLIIRTLRTVSKLIIVPIESGSCTVVQKITNRDAVNSF